MIAFALDAHPDHLLVLAANRDELHARPTQPAAWWHDSPQIFAGRDLLALGTWLGVTPSGRFAAVTNVRDRSLASARPGPKSRGALVRSFLESEGDIGDLAEKAASEGQEYLPFNLVAGLGNRMLYVREDLPHAAVIEPGVHGLSNARLDDPWWKVEEAKAVLREQAGSGLPLDREALFAMLADRNPAPDDTLSREDLPLAVARLLSARFIVDPTYGTRCSTLLVVNRDHTIDFEERSFDPTGALTGVVRETIGRASPTTVGMERSRAT